jgi:hypothetical protein
LRSEPLIELMHTQAGPETTQIYQEALAVHYWLWHWLAVSDQGTLATTRRILFDYELVEPNTEPGWVVNRGRSDLEKLAPGLYDDFDRIRFEALDGHVDPAEPKFWMDSGAGNGTTLYELSGPWLRGHGTGLSLLFSVDGTLRNWLTEACRAETLPAYRSDLLRRTLGRAEILSAAAFAAGLRHVSDYDPYVELERARGTDGGFDAQALEAIDARTSTLLESLVEHLGEDSTAAVGLGFVIDALAGRSVQPNAPGFHYERWELSPPVTQVVDDILDRYAPLVGRNADSIKAEHDAVVALAQRHVSTPDLSPDIDEPWSTRLAEHADSLKGIAFEVRRSTTDERSPSLLHDVGNALWGWSFFVMDRRRWLDAGEMRLRAVDAVEDVRRWLERPWGILTQNDVKICLAGTPSDENLPPLATPVIPLFIGGYDEFRHSLREPDLATEDAVRELIRRRCLLRDLRDPLSSIYYPRTAPMAQAELLVELVTLWFYEQTPARRSEAVDEGLAPLCDALGSGSWWAELAPSPELPQLSRRQRTLLDDYLASPRTVTDSLFEFPDDRDLVDRIDVYPPESFDVIRA